MAPDLPISARPSPITRIVRIAIYLVFLLALSEGLAFFGYRIVRGEWFSYGAVRTHAGAICAVDQSASWPPEHGGRDLEITIHPFLGFVLEPEDLPQYEISDFGFVDSTPPIHKRSAETLIVGITGGSVAESFATRGLDTLGRELMRSPRFAGRELVGVNLAVGGYKQPQQLMVLAYILALGGELDLLINLDGFNEVVLHRSDNQRAGVHYAFPRAWALLSLEAADVELLSRVGRVAYLETDRKKTACAFLQSPARFSVTGSLLWQFRASRAQRRILDANVEVNAHRPARRSFRSMGPAHRFANDAELLTELARLWKHGSTQLAKLCEANDIAYFHFLQPNQYAGDFKPMGPRERKIAFDPASLYAQLAREGYPYLTAAGADLADSDVHFRDLTRMFTEIQDPVYEDSCCHFNERGNRLLAEEMARFVMRELERESP